MLLLWGSDGELGLEACEGIFVVFGGRGGWRRGGRRVDNGGVLLLLLLLLLLLGLLVETELI